MRVIVKFNLILGLLFALASCSDNRTVHSGRIQVLDTRAEVTVVNGDEPAVQQAIADVERELKIIDHIGYTFHDDSELKQLNDAIAAGQSMQVSAELVALIQLAKRLSARSGGLLNPALGELIALWQFRCKTEPCLESPYTEEVISLIHEKEQQILASRPSMQDIILRGDVVSSKKRHLKLEFGDLIRGFALDVGIERLQRRGIHNAMLELGENIRIIGHKNQRPWWAPLHDARNGQLLGTIELEQDSAIMTVHAISRVADKDAAVYRHVIDPRTGIPARSVASVTVIHDTAALAEAAATAILVAGRSQWKPVAERMGVKHLLLFDGDGGLYITRALADRIHWKQRLAHSYLAP